MFRRRLLPDKNAATIDSLDGPESSTTRSAMTHAMPAAGTSGKAIFSLVLSLLALVCLHSGGLQALLVGLVFAAAPALVLGFLGLREINASDGYLKGRSVAITGMIIGAFSSLVFVVWL